MTLFCDGTLVLAEIPLLFARWHINETCVKVNGRWAYLYHAVDNRSLLSLNDVTAKRPTGFLTRSKQRQTVADTLLYQYGQSQPYALLKPEGQCRLILSTDR